MSKAELINDLGKHDLRTEQLEALRKAISSYEKHLIKSIRKDTHSNSVWRKELVNLMIVRDKMFGEPKLVNLKKMVEFAIVRAKWCEENECHWSEEDDNENQIFDEAYSVLYNFTLEDWETWCDKRLKYTSVERLEDLLLEVNNLLKK